MPTKILLVDDEPEVEGMVKLKFRKKIKKGDYDFVFASNGIEALNKIKENPNIDIVISDINMPEMDGLTLLSHLSEVNRVLKAIVISAYGDMQNIREAMNRGAFDFLTKPIDFEDLTVTIEKTRKTVEDIKQNIEALRKAEISLEETMALNTTIVDNALESIITVEKDGSIRSVNKATEKTFNYNNSELLHKNITDIIPDLNKDKCFNDDTTLDLSNCDLIGKPKEGIAYKSNGEQIQIGYSIIEIKFNNRVMYNTMIRDITLKKKAENLLKKYNETLEKDVKERTKELEQLNKEKNEILGIAAHDLKNPLSNIKMLAKFIKEDKLSDDEVNEFSDNILTDAERMFEMITNLLDVNRIEEGRIDFNFEEFQLDFIVDSSINSYKERATAKNIKINFEKSNVSPRIYADRNAVLQIIDNLISNAIKYSPFDKNVFISIKDKGSFVEFIVKDEGPGIQPEEQKKLFKKFSRLSSEPTGGEHSTGLGLSIVKKLIDLMNGEIRCESVPGEGAAFIASFQNVNYVSQIEND